MGSRSAQIIFQVQNTFVLYSSRKHIISEVCMRKTERYSWQWGWNIFKNLNLIEVHTVVKIIACCALKSISLWTFSKQEKVICVTQDADAFSKRIQLLRMLTHSVKTEFWCEDFLKSRYLLYFVPKLFF